MLNAKPPKCLFSPGKDEQAVVESKEELRKISVLLGLDEEEFTDCLLKPKIKVSRGDFACLFLLGFLDSFALWDKTRSF